MRITIGVDVLQLPRTLKENQYAIIFVDYLTKWPETFAVPDQTANTIARLLVEEIVARHGVPERLLYDRGPNFLSNLVERVYQLLDTSKVTTSAHHPQCDGLWKSSTAHSTSRSLPDIIVRQGLLIASESIRRVARDGVFNYASAVLNDGMLLMEFEDAVKERDGSRILRCWKSMLNYFHMAGHSNYTKEPPDVPYQMPLGRDHPQRLKSCAACSFEES